MSALVSISDLKLLNAGTKPRRRYDSIENAKVTSTARNSIAVKSRFPIAFKNMIASMVSVC
ncbi:hypothetical protein ASG33_07625 [Dyadobacter sp. Leaf189]|nr:hypothetical protein ASG33_07625 [Dyadobacter sp. Leaf189]